MRVASVFEPEWQVERDRDGYRGRGTRIGDAIGATAIGATVYELEEGQRSWPYHFHHGVEEWLLVVDGTPTVRTPAGEQTLRRGDVVCFPPGRDGAHAVIGPGRFVIFSTGSDTSVTVYPDSDKIGARPPGADDRERLNFRRADAVDYWEGE
jgi:uncharacterized cupin superfamily protein